MQAVLNVSLKSTRLASIAVPSLAIAHLKAPATDTEKQA